MTFVKSFADLLLINADEAGGKGANLGELTRAGLPVPDGFVLLASAFTHTMREAGILNEMTATHNAALAAVNDDGELTRLCRRLTELVAKAGIDREVCLALSVSYQRLGNGDDLNVAVRSSAVGEDGNDASFAGMNASFTNIGSETELLEAVRDCWASLFTPRVLTYRANQGLRMHP